MASPFRIGLSLLPALATAVAYAGPDLPPFPDVSKEYEKVTSSPDGGSLFGLYIHRKDDQLLAELPRGWDKMKFLIAATPAAGTIFSGLQGPERYVFWRQYGNRLALVQPQLDVRSTGEQTSQDSVKRIFTDSVLLEVPIVSTGPNGQPVIDLDAMLVGQAQQLAGVGFNPRLAKIAKAKSFPQNLEIAIEAPDQGGNFKVVHYSISMLPDNTGYKPRKADDRVGFFLTGYRDLGLYGTDTNATRYINRWNLEKRDPKLSLSPPKEPIVFYVENTVPVRYRRYVRDGILQWNEAFRKIGIDSAIEVYQQDEVTGAHMDKDPEDVRYNFVRWLNNDVATAIGPSRAHPLTGEILDADIILTDGWIRAFYNWYEDRPIEQATSLTPEALVWLEAHPQWDPRIQLLPSSDRAAALAERAKRVASGDTDPADSRKDPAIAASPALRELVASTGSTGHDHSKCGSMCFAAQGMASDMAFANMAFETLGLLEAAQNADPNAPKTPVETLDGVPESFAGPQLAHLVAHEVGHTLGLRHNFKASALYTLDEINSDKVKGKPLASSVMDYMGTNFNLDKENIQGDYTMIGIGPYDMWAIEYGYTFDDPAKVAARVGEPGHQYLTDEDTGGSDPLARRYDFSKDPLDYAKAEMELVKQLRAAILEKYVKDGDSWERARKGYSKTLSKQRRTIDMMAPWIGGTYVTRAKKGDANVPDPLVPVEAAKQRAALQYIIETAFRDDAYGLTPELASKMTVEKWMDDPMSMMATSAPGINDLISGTQSMALTMILNPSTLGRIYDNEKRVAADADTLTLPEVMKSLSDEIFVEISPSKLGSSDARKPVISTYRRNLQADYADRLVAVATGKAGLPRVARQLSAQELRDLKAKLDATVAKASASNCDPYTRAHLADLKSRVDAALDASIQMQ
ncbi:MAG: zinc-dependent metalloprotease [Limnohabitans sp.]|nr:zinc-dependent metalloprotease [Limnohabitans sp.]